LAALKLFKGLSQVIPLVIMASSALGPLESEEMGSLAGGWQTAHESLSRP